MFLYVCYITRNDILWRPESFLSITEDYISTIEFDCNDILSFLLFSKHPFTNWAAVIRGGLYFLFFIFLLFSVLKKLLLYVVITEHILFFLKTVRNPPGRTPWKFRIFDPKSAKMSNIRFFALFAFEYMAGKNVLSWNEYFPLLNWKLAQLVMYMDLLCSSWRISYEFSKSGHVTAEKVGFFFRRRSLW